MIQFVFQNGLTAATLGLPEAQSELSFRRNAFFYKKYASRAGVKPYSLPSEARNRANSNCIMIQLEIGVFGHHFCVPKSDFLRIRDLRNAALWSPARLTQFDSAGSIWKPSGSALGFGFVVRPEADLW